MVEERMNDLQRQVPPTADKAWLLGFMAGDGHIQWEEGQSYKVFTNCGPDADLAEIVSGLFGDLYGVPCSVLWADKSEHGNRLPASDAFASRGLLATITGGPATSEGTP